MEQFFSKNAEFKKNIRLPIDFFGKWVYNTYLVKKKEFFSDEYRKGL